MAVRRSLYWLMAFTILACGGASGGPVDGGVGGDGDAGGAADADPLAPDATCTAEELVCDGIDDDCDAVVDEGCNGDGDEYCGAGLTTTGTPAVCTGGGDDCDDSRGDIYPGAPDGCARDWNCDQALLRVNAGAPVAVRGRGPRVGGQDMASDGAGFGIVWTEETAQNAQARFALLNGSGVITQGPVDITGPTVAVTDVAVAWSAAASAYAVAYVRPNPSSGARSIYLVLVDALGAVSAPIYLDDSAPGRRLTVRAAGDYVAVFYTQRSSGQDRLRHVGYNLVSKATTTPVELFADSFLSSEAFSYAWLDNAGTEGTYLAVRYELRSGETQPYGYEISAVRGGGSLELDSAWYPFPDDETERYPQLGVVKNAPYLMWVNTTGSPDRLRVRALNAATGASTGPTVTLADNVTASSSIGAQLVQESDTIFGVTWQDNQDDAWRLQRFSTSTFAPSAPVRTLWFSDLESAHSTQAPTFFSDGNYSVLSTNAAGAGELSFFSVSSAGVQQASTAPVTSARFNSAFHSSSRLAEYDAAADAWSILQSDPADAGKLQSARVGGDGAVLQAPASHSAMPKNCDSFTRAVDGTLVCFGNRTDCSADELYLSVFDGGSWTTSLAASLTQGASCADALMPVAYLGAGRTAVIRLAQSFDVTNDLALSYEIYKAGAVLESSTPIWSVAGFSGDLTTILLAHQGGQLMLSFGTFDRGSSLGDRRVAVVTLDTGAVVTPVALIVGPTAGQIIGGTAWHFDGARFVLALTATDEATRAVSGQHLAFVPADGTAPTAVSYNARGTAIANHSVADYHLITSLDKSGSLHVTALDGTGTILETKPLGYESIGSLAVDSIGFSETARSHRLLLRNDSRLITLPTMCF